MNLKEKKYNQFALVREMMETPGIISSFKPGVSEKFLKSFKSKKACSLPAKEAAGSSRQREPSSRQ